MMSREEYANSLKERLEQERCERHGKPPVVTVSNGSVTIDRRACCCPEFAKQMEDYLDYLRYSQ